MRSQREENEEKKKKKAAKEVELREPREIQQKFDI